MADVVEAYEEHKTVWVCAVCGSLDVQHAMWVNVNTKEAFEDFGSWCNGDNNWCEQCEEHTEIVEETQINAVRVETQQEGEPVEDFLNRAMKEPKEKRT